MRPAQDKPPGTEGHHDYVAPASVKPGEPSGYVEKEYEHQEYPKVIGKDEAGNDIIADSPEQDKAASKPAAKSKYTLKDIE